MDRYISMRQVVKRFIVIKNSTLSYQPERLLYDVLVLQIFALCILKGLEVHHLDSRLCFYSLLLFRFQNEINVLSLSNINDKFGIFLHCMNQNTQKYRP